MKNYKIITKEIKQNNSKIVELEKLTNQLLKVEERQNESDFKKRMALSDSVTEEDEQKAVAACEEIEELKQINQILKENMFASFADYASEIIKEILVKYANKPVGEKTREKIKAEAKQHGFSFYAEYSGSFSVSTLTPEGYFDYVIRDCALHVQDTSGHYTTIYNKETGKLNDFTDLVIKHNYTYSENPKKQVKAIKKAMQAYKTAYYKAYELQEEVNKLLPNGKNLHYLGCGYDSMFKF